MWTYSSAGPSEDKRVMGDKMRQLLLECIICTINIYANKFLFGENDKLRDNEANNKLTLKYIFPYKCYIFYYEIQLMDMKLH